jgi:RimJ/RimL family protein N-acetyltransferase
MEAHWQPTLHDELVSIRPLLPGDHDQLFKVASDPLIWEQHPAKERAEPDGFRKFFDEASASGGALAILDRRTHEMIGSSRYHALDGFPDAIEIGWTFLARKCWGGKYNGAVKKLMLDHAFRQVKEVIFIVDKTNIRSQRAVEKLGAVELTEGDLLRLRNGEKNRVYSLFRSTAL